MDTSFNIIEYISGLTGFVLDESVLKTIATDRGVLDVKSAGELTAKDKDLLRADVLFAVYLAPNNLPSFQHQHGQFSTSTGAQQIGDKERIYNMMRNIYRKYGDERAELIPVSSLIWSE